MQELIIFCNDSYIGKQVTFPTHQNYTYCLNRNDSHLPSLVVSTDGVVPSIVLVSTDSVVAADDKLSVDSVVSTGAVVDPARRISCQMHSLV